MLFENADGLTYLFISSGRQEQKTETRCLGGNMLGMVTQVLVTFNEVLPK